ncbi:putative Lipoamide acyltransferase component of branched-chain alpha-keto acid dehydrogenase complex [Streptomyces afghaniensis 772]|uniref:Dihydrolipoamide acetyltransferase component of pyruvate dehydrogenase complex n=1 Tax=Streptomyces afghaniensis 772 TaxID=1283301 RepID=S4N3S8_9ACTN|nr:MULTISPECIES: dihydrolipoamide acetyltransferase family protein [Streptomyces]EPJ42457.1 putative Lipoamide acyltransferase component of branched-chain alpha-keto acid dehydrogenase complex [Streptomyces afghaniensis 772]UOB11593.1 2-oxo acid dehydrogenase subunit E2 [Streptomyces sp. HP-A2021]
MAQVLEFKLPDLGEGLTEAEIVRWLVEVGDVVAIDQPVVEVETAKAMVEVPCPYGGVVTARFGEEGTELPVGAPLITVAVGERPASGEADTAGAEGSGNVLVGYGTSEAPARRRRVRREQPVSGASAAGSRAVTGQGAAPVAVNGQAGAPESEDGPVPVISPLVRRLARQNGLDLRELTGSGPDGLILRADVEYALRAAARAGGAAQTAQPHAPVPQATSTATAPQPTAPQPTAPQSTAAAVHGEIRTPLKGIRGAVADKLARSRREIPDATCWVDADATELMRARTAMNAAGGPKISLLALLARICTAALARFPELNSTVDTDAREVVRFDHVHLGFAAQTDRGLVVPVVRDAHARDAESLTAEFARLTEAGRTGTLTPAELTGGTFTLNNYGVFGVDGSTPIINHPEAAMLGVGRIVPKPWVHEGELAVRQVVQLSLTFDHRVCDGGTAGGFLRYVADCVEQPAVLLRTL